MARISKARRLIEERIIYDKIGDKIAKTLEERHLAREELAYRKGRLSQMSAHAAQSQIQGIKRVAGKLGFRCSCEEPTKKKRFCHCKRR